MSFRRLWVLVKRLPSDSWTQTILRDKRPESDLTAQAADKAEQSFGPWSLTDYLLAAQVDATRENTYVTAIAGQLTPTPTPPEPTPRPGARRAKVRALNPQQLAWLQKKRQERTEG